jgi:hypothetical protein
VYDLAGVRWICISGWKATPTAEMEKEKENRHTISWT